MTDQEAGSQSSRWTTFLAEFFQAPNELSIGTGVQALDGLVAFAERSILANPSRPVIVPARVNGTTHYFGIAFNTSQSRTLRELLRSYVGTTWTDFDGRNISTAVHDRLDLAAIALAGDKQLVYKFRVANLARSAVNEAIQILVRSLEVTPPREARLALPIGRMVGDLNDACAAGAEHAAEAAYALLASDYRISATNRLFLQTQLLASFQRWQELESHPSFGDLLRLNRPALASDALARLAMSKLPSTPDVGRFAEVGGRYGALIESVTGIRSVAGARYYTLWALAGDEDIESLRLRLRNAGWLSDPMIDDLTRVSGRVDDSASMPHRSDDELRTTAQHAIGAGRFDAAVEALSQMTPAPEDLPAVIQVVTQTFTAEAIELLQRHRTQHGDEALRRATLASNPSPTAAAFMDLRECLEKLFDSTLAGPEWINCSDWITARGPAELRAVGGTEVAVGVIRAVTASSGETVRLTPGIDLCIDLVRDLKVGGAQPDLIRALGQSTLELWAYHDRSGDRHRAGRIASLAGDLAEVGLGIASYDEVVELLRAGWDAFLTDADLPIGLDLLEMLLAYRPDGTASVDTLARPMLSRIGSHNISRLPGAALAVAIDIAPSFGLEIEAPIAARGEHGTPPTARPGTKIALYSLLEPALERASRILRVRHPELEVVTSADHVATEALRNAARTADLVVIMDRAATHAATNALRTERRISPIRYAMGKGSTSLVEAVEAWLSESLEAS